MAFGATLRLHQRLVSVRAVPTRWVEVPKRCPQGAHKVPKRCPIPRCLHLCAQLFQFKAQCLDIMPSYHRLSELEENIFARTREAHVKKSCQTDLACNATLIIFPNKDKFLTRMHIVRFPRSYILLLSILQNLFDLFGVRLLLDISQSSEPLLAYCEIAKNTKGKGK